MNNDQERKTLNISRYSSRRLYNTGAGEYVTVDELAKYIRAGHDIKVTDKKTGQDITGQILLQIIADQEAESGSVLPTNVLTDIVRHYSSETRNLVPSFLAESFERLKEHRQKISGSLLDQIANPLDPSKAINSFETLRSVQSDIVDSVLSAWLPKNSDSKKTQEHPAKDNSTTGKPQEDGLQDELEALKQQMAEMQNKIAALDKK
ncbi:MAG: polyhydroxyalkanoate synthesis regulator DNA-binding domain-containing protein [Rhizobiaceae bacterium]|nr:polyhydroxyalkanoate synthesis regulator DNA-binding domain-containing protein [Rhizobiaceae bacterium]